MGTSSTTILRSPDEKVDHLRSLPFYAVHLGALLTPFILGLSWEGVAIALGFYFLRMVGVTLGYHRYFSHRAFKTSRAFQFVLAVLATSSSQKGVLWWAAHHRHHHRFSDRADDLHSPRKGFWWSHVGWFLCDKYQATQEEGIRDFARYPELRWLDRNWGVVVVAFAALLFALGGWVWLLWGFFVSTTLLWHGTFVINSLAHVFGRRRYGTSDDSRNSFLLAVLTCGEGWHNNHHHYQSSSNQGFYWWEWDPTYYLLKLLAAAGVVWDLRKPPERVLTEGRRSPLPVPAAALEPNSG
ncbi:MAG: acyl-CoA desaturase [Deltaproteobacteria bacterium]|nr:acyl-CoA desaturase [Deltaproteobacteria bacterium]